MIALNGPEKNGQREGGKTADRMSGVVVFGRWTADVERRVLRGRSKEMYDEGKEREDADAVIESDGKIEQCDYFSRLK